MAIPKRELQLSQDLMELQSRYNRLNMENNRITTLLRLSVESGRLLADGCERLEKEIEILKETIPSAIAFTPKKKTRKAV